MNLGQKITISVGMLLIFMMVLFPPYKSILYKAFGMSREIYVGYGLFFYPLGHDNILKRIANDSDNIYGEKTNVEKLDLEFQHLGIVIYPQIDYQRLTTQIILCIILIFGIVLLQNRK